MTNQLEAILKLHAESVPLMEELKTRSVALFNLNVEFLHDRAAELPGNGVRTLTLAVVLDPAMTPRTADTQLEALKSQWPEARFETVFDRVSGKSYVFVI